MKKLLMLCAWGCLMLGADAAIVLNHNLGATNVAATRADLTATITDTGAAPVYVIFYWGASDGGTNAGDWSAAQMPSTNTYGTGTVSTVLYALAPASQYWFRAYAWNTSEYAWASASTNFTSLDNSPTSTYAIATRHLSSSNWVIQDWATLRASNDVASAAALGSISNDYLSKQGLASDYNGGGHAITNLYGISATGTNQTIHFGGMSFDFNSRYLTNIGRIYLTMEEPKTAALTMQTGTNLWWGQSRVLTAGNLNTADLMSASAWTVNNDLTADGLIATATNVGESVRVSVSQPAAATQVKILVSSDDSPAQTPQLLFGLDVGPTGTVWTSLSDGTGSGLDADMLDGSHAGAYVSTDTWAAADSTTNYVRRSGDTHVFGCITVECASVQGLRVQANDAYWSADYTAMTPFKLILADQDWGAHYLDVWSDRFTADSNVIAYLSEIEDATGYVRRVEAIWKTNVFTYLDESTNAVTVTNIYLGQP